MSIQRKANAQEQRDKSRARHYDADPFRTLVRRARLGKSYTDLDGIVYRASAASEFGAEPLMVIETATFSAADAEKALGHYRNDLLKEGGTRVFQGRLLRLIGARLGVPVVFVAYRRTKRLSDEDPVYLLRLDIADSQWRCVTAGRFIAGLRNL